MVATDLARHMTREDMQEMRARAARNNAPPSSRQDVRDVADGAATTMWAATSPELEGRGGIYLADCAVSDGWTDYARDPVAARRLWDLSVKLVNEAPR